MGCYYKKMGDGGTMNTRISVRNVKEFRELSDDSLAFSCTVLFDGEVIAKASDNGNGGAIRFDRLGESGKYAEAEAYAKSLPMTPLHVGDGQEPLMIQTDLEVVVNALVIDTLNRKEEIAWFKRNCKKNVLFRIKGDKVGTWRTIKGAFTPQVKAHIVAKYGETLEEIANETRLG